MMWLVEYLLYIPVALALGVTWTAASRTFAQRRLMKQLDLANRSLDQYYRERRTSGLG